MPHEYIEMGLSHAVSAFQNILSMNACLMILLSDQQAEMHC